MPTSSGPNTVNDSVIFAYDVADIINSYKGRPTDNLIANATLNVYNNVPSHVTASITQTSDYYKGAPIWKETITPTTSTGVSYLTNGNNPGIGVYHTGGGGIANRYAGHTIFFKPIGPMYSSPIFTNYSNIVGWQSTNQYDDMGDGWFRAKVLWYDTTTRTDNKFWAINPAGAIIDAPITIYWAGPFKEDLNSPYISQFADGVRSVSGSLLDISGIRNNINVSNVSFDSNLQIFFDGTDDYINANVNLGASCTIETIIKSANYENKVPISIDGDNYSSGPNIYFASNVITWNIGDGTANPFSNSSYPNSNYHHLIITNDYYGIATLYIDGVKIGTASFLNATTTGANKLWIGRFHGDNNYTIAADIPVVKIYNRTLSINEVVQNYNSYKKRFNLS